MKTSQNALSRQWKMTSEVGDVYIVASEKGIQSIYFQKRSPAPMLENIQDGSPQSAFLAQAVRELTEYFAGRRKTFSLPLDVQGTDFQSRVWQELVKIPYGQSTSYKAIADKLGTKGVRAVGTANGRNPVSIIVPCHRVIASDGTLGGYSGGLPVKKKLLELESNKEVFIRAEKNGMGERV